MKNDKYKVAVFDLDGTIVNNDKNNVSKNVKMYLQKWKSMGNHVAIATGRPWFECDELINELKPCWPIVCLDGRLIYDYQTNRAQQVKTISYFICQNLMESLQDDYYVYIEDLYNVYAQDKLSSLLFTLFFRTKREKVITNSLYVCDPLRIYIRCKNKQNGIPEKDKARIKEIVGSNSTLFIPEKNWMVITSDKSNKSDAIEKLALTFGVTMDEVVAFGDGENDRELLKRAGLGVVMQNATLETKSVADLITDTVENDGVVRVMRKLLNNGG